MIRERPPTIEAAFDLADHVLTHERSLGESFELDTRLQKLPESDRPRADLHLVEFSGKIHTKDRDRRVISYHYDLPAGFYALWLGQQAGRRDHRPAQEGSREVLQ